MKRLLTICSILMLAMVFDANASNTRVLTLGDNNGVLVDEANIWEFPGRINWYPQLGVAEIGWGNYYNDDLNASGGSYSGDITQFGIHWPFGSEDRRWVLATYLYNEQPRLLNEMHLALGMPLPYRYPAPNLSDWVSYPDDPYGATASNQRVSLFYGRTVGTNKLGINVNWTGSSESVEADGFNPEWGMHQYDFAVGLTEGTGLWDASVGISLFGFKNVAASGDDIYKPKGNMSFWGKFRYFKSMNPQWTWVPHFGLIYGKYGADYFGGTTSEIYNEEYKVLNFSAGSGVNWMPISNVMIVGDAGVSFLSGKYNYSENGNAAADFEVKTSIITLPYLKMGLEGDVFDWLVVRLGANSYWHWWTDEYTDDTDNEKDKYAWPDNGTYLGFGLEFGRLHVDMRTHPELFLNGFNFISGDQTYDMNSQISVVYTPF